jgi:hypothetical protein
MTGTEMPGSAQDFAKAFLILTCSAADLRKAINPIMEAVDRRRARKAAANLDTLRFRSGEMRQPLERIARGGGTAADRALLSAMLKASAEKVEGSIEALRTYGDEVREKFGMESVSKLDDIIFDKIEIRQRLRDLTNDEDYLYQATDKASEVSAMIDRLNDSLISIHDMILPPKATPKTASRKKRK